MGKITLNIMRLLFVVVLCITTQSSCAQDENLSLFIAATKENNTFRMQDILSRDPGVANRSRPHNNPESRERHTNAGWTPLHYAADMGYPDAVQLLLNAGASVDSMEDEGYTPIYYAASRGHADITQMLVNAGASVTSAPVIGETLLGEVIGREYSDVAQVLLRAGARLDEKSKIKFLSEGSKLLPLVCIHDPQTLEYCKINTSEKEFTTLENEISKVQSQDFCSENYTVSRNRRKIKELQKTIRNGDNYTLQEAITRNPRIIDEIGADGKTLLHEAATQGNVSAIQMLIKAGASVNQTGRGGYAALHSAISILEKENRVPTIKTLLDAHANVNQQSDNGTTPVHIAATFGNPDTVQTLLNAGASINQADKTGATPLYQSACWSPAHAPTVEILLRAGACLDKKSFAAILKNMPQVLPTACENQQNLDFLKQHIDDPLFKKQAPTIQKILLTTSQPK